MNSMIALRGAVDRLLEGSSGLLLDLLADDVEFEVVTGGNAPSSSTEWGKPPVAGYFARLGGLVAFWQMDYTANGEQVIAWGKESFTVEHIEVEGGCEFALVFDVRRGVISRLLVIEDLPAFMSQGRPLSESFEAVHQLA